jgi:hypothetical protein
MGLRKLSNGANYVQAAGVMKPLSHCNTCMVAFLKETLFVKCVGGNHMDLDEVYPKYLYLAHPFKL